MRWAAMDEAARDALCGRGLDEIFDADAAARRSARSSTTCATNGDDAVCDALPASTGSTLTPDQLRVHGRRDRRGHASATRSTRAIDDAIAHLPGVQRAADGPRRRLELRERARAARRREGHADRVGRAVRAVAARRATRASPTSSACRPWSPACPRSRSSCRRCPAATARVDPAVLVVCRKLGIARRVPGQRAGGRRRARLRHRDDPGGAQDRRARLARRSPAPRSRCSATGWPR